MLYYNFQRFMLVPIFLFQTPAHPPSIFVSSADTGCLEIYLTNDNNQGTDFDDMSSFISCEIDDCRPRWSRANVLASSSKVRGFKPG